MEAFACIQEVSEPKVHKGLYNEMAGGVWVHMPHCLLNVAGLGALM